MNDLFTLLEICFEAIFESLSAQEAEDRPRRLGGVPCGSFERYGYKAILYIQHCLRGLSFPQGGNLKPESKVKGIRAKLLRLLCRDKYQPSTRVVVKKSSSDVNGWKVLRYPYIRALVAVDAKATLDTIEIVFNSHDAYFQPGACPDDNQIITMNGWQAPVDEGNVEGDENDNHNEVEHGRNNATRVEIDDESTANDLYPERMTIVRIASYVVSAASAASGMVTSIRSRTATNALHCFLAKYLLLGVIRTPAPLTLAVIEYVTMKSSLSSTPTLAEEANNDLLALIRALPRRSFDRDGALDVIEHAQISRAALLLHRWATSEILDTVSSGGCCDVDKCAMHFTRVIECHLEDELLDRRNEVFDYIRGECIGGRIALSASGDKCDNEYKDDEFDINVVHNALRDALCQKLPSLVNLNPVQSSQLVAELYVDDLEAILQSLKDAEAGLVQYKFLHTIISGELCRTDSVAGPVLLANLTVDHHQTYLALMAKFHPEDVYQHLVLNDNYRTEECLKLCQEQNIADASAYLLERKGNISSALQLLLQTLEGRMLELKRVVRGLGDNPARSQHRINLSNLNNQKRKTADAKMDREKEICGVRQILMVSLDLCERNSVTSTISSDYGSQLWFNVLDRLINAKGFLRLGKELPEHATVMLQVLSDFLQLTMQRMVSKVPLPDLVRKITTDHASNRLSEFREMIATMLMTYNSELRVCTNSLEVMQYDLRQMSLEKCRLKVRYLLSSVKFVDYDKLFYLFSIMNIISNSSSCSI